VKKSLQVLPAPSVLFPNVSSRQPYSKTRHSTSTCNMNGGLCSTVNLDYMLLKMPHITV
jgi:hypothetical protein